MNTQNAYLGSNLNKEIYMKVPEDVEINENEIYLLLKSLYGLKQLINL